MGVPYAEVIGDPIAHSKSPLIHKFWLEKLGLQADYRAVRVTRATLAEYLSARSNDPAWRGCNVTMPLKSHVLSHLSEINDEAERLGAVNCIAPRPEGLWGTNFDSAALMEIMASQQWEGHATLLGNGGAARAALWAVSLAGFERITVLARDPAKTSQMIESLGVKAEAAPMGSTIQGHALINATPLGMAGYPPLDVSLDGMGPGSAVLDMVYEPVETALLAAARRKGFRTIDGFEMLMEQAAMSFVTFFDAAPDQSLRDECREFLTS